MSEAIFDPTQHPDPTDERAGLPSASDPAFGKCPGKQQLVARIPKEDEKPDEEAERGTRIHESFQTGNTLPLSTDELEDYQAGLKFTEQLINEWQRERDVTVVTEGPREQRLWYNDPNTLQPAWSGQLDRHYLGNNGTEALVVDLKSGWATHVPMAGESSQLRKQAVLLWKEHPEITAVRVAFVKPKVWKGGVDDRADYTLTDLQMSELSIQLEAWESSRPGAQRVAGPHCRYCRGKSVCPEAGAYAMLPSVIARQVARSEEMPWEMMVAHMAPADLARINDMATVVGKIIEAVKTRLKGMTSDELANLGLMLPEHGRKVDYIAAPNVPMAFKKLTDHFATEDVLQSMDFVKGRLAEVVMKERNLNKADAETWIDQNLDPFITRAFAAPSLRKIKA